MAAHRDGGVQRDACPNDQLENRESHPQLAGLLSHNGEPALSTITATGLLDKMNDSKQTVSGAASGSTTDFDVEAAVDASPIQKSIGEAKGIDYGGTLEKVNSTGTTATLDFPEGGLQAWLVVLGAFCASLSIFGVLNTSAVFESYFSNHQLASHSSSDIGWIFSLYLFIVFFVGVQAGPIFDRYGPKWLIAGGTLLIIASLLLLSWCHTYYQIMLTYSVVGGLGGAMLHSPAYSVIAHYFNARRGFATGVAATSGSVGGIIFPILLRELLPGVGFAWSCRILAFIMMALAVPANLFIRTRLPPVVGSGSVWPDFGVLKDLRFALASLAVFFMEFGLFIPLTFLVSYAVAHGHEATESYLLLSYMNAGSFLGRVLPGFMADKIGRFNTIIITISLCMLTVFAIWLPAGDSMPMIIAYSVSFGFASGSNLGLIPVCIGQLCDSRNYGSYFSTAIMVASFASLSGPPIGGALLDVSAVPEVGWRALILFAGLSYTIALACFMWARVIAIGWNPRAIF